MKKLLTALAAITFALASYVPAASACPGHNKTADEEKQKDDDNAKVADKDKSKKKDKAEAKKKDGDKKKDSGKVAKK